MGTLALKELMLVSECLCLGEKLLKIKKIARPALVSGFLSYNVVLVHVLPP